MIKLKDILFEGTDPKRFISRREEAEGISFIRERVMPEIVERWNYDNRQQKKYYINKQDLIKTFKKVGHHIHDPSDKTTTDVIQYQSTTDKSTMPFEFELYKEIDKNGSFIAAWLMPGDSNYRTKYISRRLTENIGTGHDEPNLRISKMEEQHALQFLRKDVLPIVANNWNKACNRSGSPDWYVTAEMISKHLKKVGHEIGKANDVIEYSSIFEIGAGTLEFSSPFQFKIYKQLSDGKMMISWALPGSGFNYNSATVFVGYGPLVESDNRIMHLTKSQESEAVDFIRKTLIPHAVKKWNTVRDGIQKIEVNAEELIKNLRKIEDKRGPRKSQSYLEKIGEYSSDTATYATHMDSNPKYSQFRFNIGTGTDGSLIIFYHPPISAYARWYSVHTPINENIEPHSSINKVEEEQALRYINRNIIPDMIDRIYNGEFLRKYPGADLKSYPRIGYPSVRKNLKKVGENSYMSTITDALRFRFNIHKRQPNIDDIYVNAIMYTGKGLRATNREKLYRVGLGLSENIENNDVPLVSKADELEALDYLQKTVIPQEVSKYNVRHYNATGISPADIIQNLKKKTGNVYDSDINRNRITYRSEFTKRGYPVAFVFDMEKHPDGNIYVFSNDMLFNASGKRYKVNEMKTPTLKELLYENTEIGPITKIEEEQNLAAIIKQLFPMVLEMENRRRRQVSTPTSDLKSKDIIKTLKKAKVGPYLKIYTIDFPTKKKSVFNQPKFGIYKNHKNGMVMIGWEVSDRIGWHWFNVDTNGELRAVEGDDIPRSTIGMAGMSEDVESLNEIAERLNREEELEALDYIQKDLISTVLQDEYLHFLVKFPKKYPLADYPRITTKDINKNLKKIRSSHDTAVYESIITDDIFFEFHIQKIRGHIMIGFNGPINTSWTWYTLGGKKKTNTRENLNEALDTNHPSCLTKMEEEAGVAYITKVLIPKHVNFRNENNRSGKTNVKDVAKTLTKINQIKSGYAPCITSVVYQALFQGEPYLYTIYKSHTTGSGKGVFIKSSDGVTVKLK